MMVEPLSTAFKKSYVIQDREKSENANLLCLNSGDNDKAECLATYIEDHHKRSIDWVSFIILQFIYKLQFISNKHKQIIIYICIQYKYSI